MTTIRDLLEQFTIEGALRIQSFVDDDGNYEVFFDTENHDHDLDGKNYDWLDKEIEYMYPSTTYSKNEVEIPQIVIEISSEED